MEDLRVLRDGREAHGDEGEGASSLSQDWLIPFLLLFMRDGVSYDGHLEERIGELGFGGVRLEEMYRTLWKMEREGMILCYREGSGFKIPRWRYSIAEPGEAYLEFWADSLEQYREEVDLYLRTYADGSARRSVG
jgi:PadR family transcriptional regulator PadR